MNWDWNRRSSFLRFTTYILEIKLYFMTGLENKEVFLTIESLPELSLRPIIIWSVVVISSQIDTIENVNCGTSIMFSAENFPP